MIPERTDCRGCDAPLVPGLRFYCDRDAAAGPWCGDCFDYTPCGQARHGEGCATVVFEDTPRDGTITLKRRIPPPPARPGRRIAHLHAWALAHQAELATALLTLGLIAIILVGSALEVPHGR